MPRTIPAAIRRTSLGSPGAYVIDVKVTGVDGYERFYSWRTSSAYAECNARIRASTQWRGSNRKPRTWACESSCSFSVESSEAASWVAQLDAIDWLRMEPCRSVGSRFSHDVVYEVRIRRRGEQRVIVVQTDCLMDIEGVHRRLLTAVLMPFAGIDAVLESATTDGMVKIQSASKGRVATSDRR